MQSIARHEPEPTLGVTAHRMYQTTESAHRCGAVPAQRCVPKQSVRRSQPKGTTRLDRHIQILARGDFFAFSHLRLTWFCLVESQHAHAPKGLIWSAPGLVQA